MAERQEEMKIPVRIPNQKQPLPEGKMTMRWVQSRAVWQIYIGGRYVSGCSGSTHGEAVEQLMAFYELDEDSENQKIHIKWDTKTTQLSSPAKNQNFAS